MFLATGSSFDFIQFLQIICWILFPALLLAVILTVYFHFRKKKFAESEEDAEEKLMMGTPELVGYTNGDGEYVCFDHSPLISEYKNRLSYTHARFTALHHDFETLESRYQALASYAIAHFRNKNENLMENTNEKLPRQMQEELDQLAAQYQSEKLELQTKLEQLNQCFKNLEEENQLLQDQVNMQHASGEEREAIVTRWKEENRALKEKVAEHQYLQDILGEKKAQIDFLQNQLEQRVKMQHEAEQQRELLQVELEETRNQQAAGRQLEEHLQKELLHQKEETDKLQVVVCAKEELLNERQQLLASKEEHISRLENMLNEVRQQEGGLNTVLTEANEKIAGLQELLAFEREKSQSLEQRSTISKQALQRIYNEFSSIIEGDNAQSPVIALRPAYLERPDDEIAVH